MKNIILSLLFLFSLTFVMPVQAETMQRVEIIDNDFDEITISVNESTLHVTNAAGQMLYIYNVAGVRVMAIKVDSQDKRYELNLPKGCYIIKVGKVVRKVSIK